MGKKWLVLVIEPCTLADLYLRENLIQAHRFEDIEYKGLDEVWAISCRNPMDEVHYLRLPTATGQPRTVQL